MIACSARHTTRRARILRAPARWSSGAKQGQTVAFELQALYNEEGVESLAQNQIYGGTVATTGGAGHLPDHLAKYAENPIRDKYVGKLANKLASGSANAQLKKSGRALREGAAELLEALHREGAYTVAVCPHDGFFKLPEDAVKERVLLRKGQAPDPAVLRRLVPGCGPGGSVTLCGTTSPFLEAAAATGAPAIALAPHPLGARDVPRGWEGVIPSVAAPKAKKRGDEGGSGGGLLSSLARALNKDEDADAEEGASSAAGAGQAPLLAVRSLHEVMDALDGMDEQRQ